MGREAARRYWRKAMGMLSTEPDDPVLTEYLDREFPLPPEEPVSVTGPTGVKYGLKEGPPDDEHGPHVTLSGYGFNWEIPVKDLPSLAHLLLSRCGGLPGVVRAASNECRAQGLHVYGPDDGAAFVRDNLPAILSRLQEQSK